MFNNKKRVLDNNAKTKKFLDSLPKIYLIGVWAKCGVREHYYAGFTDKDGMPFVWDYDDHNGTCDNWYLRRLDYTTTGSILSWTIDKTQAEHLAESYNLFEYFNSLKFAVTMLEESNNENMD